MTTPRTAPTVIAASVPGGRFDDGFRGSTTEAVTTDPSSSVLVITVVTKPPLRLLSGTTVDNTDENVVTKTEENVSRTTDVTEPETIVKGVVKTAVDDLVMSRVTAVVMLGADVACGEGFATTAVVCGIGFVAFVVTVSAAPWFHATLGPMSAARPGTMLKMPDAPSITPLLPRNSS